MNYRFTSSSDAHALAVLNHALIRDEGHRNRMTIEQLAERMAWFLADGYRAVVFDADGSASGYALYKFEPEWVYLRQFYVKPEFRRQGVGRAALKWLRSDAWSGQSRVRVEVLIGNATGIAFWRAVGFVDYCLTLEWEQSE